MTKRRIELTAWSFSDFLYVIESKVKEGWSISRDNKGFPESSLGIYTCHMTQGMESSLEIKLDYVESELYVPEDVKTVIDWLTPEELQQLINSFKPIPKDATKRTTLSLNKGNK